MIMFANSANRVKIRLQMTFFWEREISVAHRAFATMLLKIRAWSDRAFNYSCVHKQRTSRLAAFRAATKHITSTVQLWCLSVQHLLDALHPSAKKGAKVLFNKSYRSPRGKTLRFWESCLSYQRLHGLLLQALTTTPAPSSQGEVC